MVKTVTQAEVATARTTYDLMIISVLFSVPCSFIIATRPYGETTDYSFILLNFFVPLVCYLPQFYRLAHPSEFVYLHARQAVVLILVCAGLGTWGRSVDVPVSSFLFMILGVVWLFGVLGGRSQAGRGACWLGNIQARIIAEPDGGKTQTTQVALTEEAPVPAAPTPRDINRAIYIQEALRTPQALGPARRQRTLMYLLEDFRSAEAGRRQGALAALEKLGEVETF